MNLSEQYKILLEKKDHIINKLKNLNYLEKRQLIDFFSKKPNLENKIDWNNPDLTFDDFKEVMKPTKTEKKKRFKLNGITELEENQDYYIFKTGREDIKAFIPLSHDASVKLASNYIGGTQGQWCVAQSNDDSYFRSYCGDEHGYGVLIFFITPETKYAVLDTEYNKVEIYDAEDNDISIDQFNEETGLDIEELTDNTNWHVINRARGIFQDEFMPELTEEYNASFYNSNIPNTTEKSVEIIDYYNCKFFKCYGYDLEISGDKTYWTDKETVDDIVDVEPEEEREQELPLFDNETNESVITVYHNSILNEDGEEKVYYGVLEGTTWDCGGTFDGGTFKDGEWNRGKWLDGEFDYSIWNGGTFTNGTIINSIFNAGIIEYAVIERIEFYDGTIKDCVWYSGTFHNGQWFGGQWLGGNWKNGHIFSEKFDKYIYSTVNPKEFYKYEKNSDTTEELKNMVS